MMEELLLFLLIAVIMIILIPVFPQMIRFRIKVLRILKWNSLADFHERNFAQIVIIARIVIVLIIIFLMVLAFVA
jgi:hypothetical protein